MADSPRISVRVSTELHAKIIAGASDAEISPSIFARRILAKALRDKGLASIRPMGRPKKPE